MLLVAIGGVTYLGIYLDRHKDLLESAASAALGREVRIDDGVAVDWSMRPTLILSGLWIGNPDWAKGEYLGRAGHAVAQLDIGALLHRRLRITRVILQDADIGLERGPDGRGNWTFVTDERAGAGMLVDTSVGAVKVETSAVRFRSSRGTVEGVRIKDLAYTGGAGTEATLHGELRHRDLPLTLTATWNRPLAAGNGESPFSARVATQDATLNVSGNRAGLAEFTDVELTLRSNRFDLEQAGVWFALDPSATGSLQQIEGQWLTAGDTPEALLKNLEGTLKIASVRVELPASKGQRGGELAVKGAELTVAPKQPVRARGQVAYRGQAFELALTGGTLTDLIESERPWESLQVAAQGRFADQPLRIEGKIGPLTALLRDARLDTDLTVNHHDTQAKIQGTLAGLRGLKGSRLAIDASGPDLSHLTPWLGVDLPQTPPFQIAGRLEIDDRVFAIRKLTAKVGDSDLGGELRVPLDETVPIEGRITSDTLDLTPYLATENTLPPDTQRLLERELAPDVLQGIDGRLQFRAKRVLAGDVRFDGVKLDAELQNGHLTLTAAAGEERLTVDVDLKPREADWQLTLRHKGQLDLAWLVEHEQDGDSSSQAPLALDLHLDGRGQSLADILGTANGSFEMAIGTGYIEARLARILPLGDVLATLLNVIDPDRADNRTGSQLECAVVHLDFANGVGTSTHGLALRTDRINVLGGGAVKLRTGEIELHFKTATRKLLGLNILGIADRFLRLTGTIRNPTVSADAKGFLVHGVAAWATGGVSLVYDLLVRRLTAFSNPCETVLKAETP